MVSDDITKPVLPCITVRPTLTEKRRFAALAGARGISESALALIAIRSLLDSNPSGAESTPPGSQEPASDRITIRLRPGDGRVIGERASRRGMKASKYLAALVRAHIARDPPLATAELAAVKQAVVVLAALGRLLAQLSRNVAQSSAPPADLLRDLSRTRTVVAELERRTHDLARAALISWETRYD